MDRITSEDLDILISLGKSLNGTKAPGWVTSTLVRIGLGLVDPDGIFIYGGPDPSEY